jgi:integrase
MDEQLNKTFEEFLKDYRYAELTIRNYVYRQREYMKYYDFTEKDVMNYIRKRKYSLATMHFIKLLLDWHKQPHLLTTIPERRGTAKPHIRNKIKYLNQNEIKLLIDYCNTHYMLDIAIAIKFMYKYGLRIRELATLDKACFNLEQNEMMIIGKGNKPRTILITQEDSNYIKNVIKKFGSDEKLFSVGSKRKDVNNIIRYIYSRINKVGKIVLPYIRNVHPHMLRHSCGTYLAEQGVGLHEIKDYLGHANIMTTQIYVEVTNKRKFRDYSEKLGEVLK